MFLQRTSKSAACWIVVSCLAVIVIIAVLVSLVFTNTSTSNKTPMFLDLFTHAQDFDTTIDPDPSWQPSAFRVIEPPVQSSIDGQGHWLVANESGDTEPAQILYTFSDTVDFSAATLFSIQCDVTDLTVSLQLIDTNGRPGETHNCTFSSPSTYQLNMNAFTTVNKTLIHSLSVLNTRGGLTYSASFSQPQII
jgi:hypothetical protein